MSQGTYYLGRVVKLGMLTQERFMDAIINSPIISHNKFAWAITDVIDARNEIPSFIFGRLSKFSQEAHQKVVDTMEKSQIDALTKNLLIASAPFVYLPEFSGIAYLHVWNQIQENIFPKRFASIIEAAYSNFFVGCHIEPISDYETFVTKLSEMEHFTEISVRVHPPNPLFGRLWASLKEYVDRRNASELLLEETSKDSAPLETNITYLMRNLAQNPNFQPEKIPDITDAAILMAADGYGHGKVVGRRNGEIRVVTTSKTKKNFSADKDPDPLMLAQQAITQFKQVSQERSMNH